MNHQTRLGSFIKIFCHQKSRTNDLCTRTRNTKFQEQKYPLRGKYKGEVQVSHKSLQNIFKVYILFFLRNTLTKHIKVSIGNINNVYLTSQEYKPLQRQYKPSEKGGRGICCQVDQSWYSQSDFCSFTIGFMQLLFTVAPCYWRLALLWFFNTQCYLSLGRRVFVWQQLYIILFKRIIDYHQLLI